MIIAIIIGAIVGAYAIGAVARALYQKTGVNTLKRFNKFIWYVEAIALVMSFSLETPVVFILLFVVFSAIQFLLCMKAGIVGAIIMGILHGVGGAFFAMLNVIVFLLSLYTGKGVGGIGGIFSIDETSREVQQTNETVDEAVQMREKVEAEKRQNQQEAADAYAQRLGFRDANDAERAGFNTGKPQD